MVRAAKHVLRAVDEELTRRASGVCPKDPEFAPLRTGRVMFLGPKATVDVEIADNDRDRQRGLMYRTRMAGDRGMLFVFEREGDHAIWMRNTRIPLDVLFIDGDGRIVGIKEHARPMSDDTFDCVSKYVLEVNGGWTRAHGVRVGQRVKIEGI